MTLSALLKRIEKASEPSRKLDAEIIEGLRLGYTDTRKGEHFYWPDIEQPGIPLPLLTSSLDAAIILVEAQASADIAQDCLRETLNEVCKRFRLVTEFWDTKRNGAYTFRLAQGVLSAFLRTKIPEKTP